MIPAISQVCTLGSSFDQDVVGSAAAERLAMEIWITKLETYLRDHTVSDAQELLSRHRIIAPVASLQGGLLATTGEAETVAWDQFRSRLGILRDLGCRTVVVAADVPYSAQAIAPQDVMDRLGRAADTAGQDGLRIALEFQGRSAFLNNLRTAVAVVEQVSRSNLGICLDVFQFEVGPSKESDLQLITETNLFHVQACDLANYVREWCGDSERILPGEGDIHLDPLWHRLHEIAYSGYVALEVMNPGFSQSTPEQMAYIARQVLARTEGGSR